MDDLEEVLSRLRISVEVVDQSWGHDLRVRLMLDDREIDSDSVSIAEIVRLGGE